MDAIPAIGTPVALRIIKEKFLAGELSVAETAQALISSVHMVAASSEAIEMVKVRAKKHIAVSNTCGQMNPL